jgi:hypothetical protein
VLGELPGQPLVPVHVDLELEGKPRLQLDMDQAEIAVHEVVVEEETLAFGGLNEGRALLPAEGEGPAGFERREDSDQAVLDVVALSELTGEGFLVRPLSKVLVGTPLARGHLMGMGFHARRLSQHEALDLPPANARTLQETRHRVATEEREVSAENHPVKAGEDAFDLVGVLRNELVHAHIAYQSRRNRNPSAPAGSNPMRETNWSFPMTNAGT